MQRSIHITTALIICTLALTLAVPIARAAARERCFPETGYCVSGAILDYWERNGGLAVFGYPIGPLTLDEIVEGTWVGPTQWFERDRLEDHGAQGVLAGRLGARALELRGIDWWSLPPVFTAGPGCTYFPETRHSLCEPFLSYWRNNGGLTRFGYPIGEPQTETIETWTGTVQYFERRRMEHHTELAGTAYEVLLGRLGADIFAAAPPTRCTTVLPPEFAELAAQLPFKDSLGCPTALYRNVPAAMQHMERGVMLWINLGADGKYVHVIHPSLNPETPMIHSRYPDTWQEGVDPIEYTSAPPGLYAPKRGFGKVWFQYFRRNPAPLGLGVEPEQSDIALVQRYTSGATLILMKNGGMFYAFGTRQQDWTATSNR
jgi:hypothetical protein